MSIFKRITQKKDNKKPAKPMDRRNRSLKRISIVSTILVIVVLLAFNILFDRLLGPILKWDWSAGEQYSVGDVTKEILASMEADVEIVGLFDENNDKTYGDIRLLLDDYVRNSNGRSRCAMLIRTRLGNYQGNRSDGYMNLAAICSLFIVRRPHRPSCNGRTF